MLMLRNKTCVNSIIFTFIFIIPFLALYYLLVNAYAESAGEVINPSVQDLCYIYQTANPMKTSVSPTNNSRVDIFTKKILENCLVYTSVILSEENHRPSNLREVAINSTAYTVSEDSNNVSSKYFTILGNSQILRSGQIYKSKHSLAILKKLKIRYIVDLRFDYKWNTVLHTTNRVNNNNNNNNNNSDNNLWLDNYKSTFGSDTSFMPVTSTEEDYRYLEEKIYIENSNMESVYLPTIPETEYLIGNYLPKFDINSLSQVSSASYSESLLVPNKSQPYLCRLPYNIKPGEWEMNPPFEIKIVEKNNNDVKNIFDENKGILVSSDPECKNLYGLYGEEQVLKWRKEVLNLSAAATNNFIQTAKSIINLADKGKVLFHCAGGADRTGRVAAYIELELLKVTPRELMNYRGPLSDSKLDLIALNYLLSQRKGSSTQYKYFFPNRNGKFFYQLSPLYLALRHDANDLDKPGLR